MKFAPAHGREDAARECRFGAARVDGSAWKTATALSTVGRAQAGVGRDAGKPLFVQSVSEGGQ